MNTCISKKVALLIAVAISVMVSVSTACAGPTAGTILIVYSSYTGNTKAACEALQKSLGAKVIEVKDLKNPPENLKVEKGAKPKWVLDVGVHDNGTKSNHGGSLVSV